MGHRLRQGHMVGALAVNLDDASPARMPALTPGESSIGATTVMKLSFMAITMPVRQSDLPCRLQIIVLVLVHEFAVRIEGADHALERAVNEFLIR